MTEHAFYLHGFASSPYSRMARFLKRRFKSWDVRVETPDLNVPDFPHLSLEAMVQQLRVYLDRSSPDSGVFLIGSSLGAMVAMRFLETASLNELSRFKKLALLAPSFEFAQNRIREIGRSEVERWKSTGWRCFYHYGMRKGQPLHFRFYEEMSGCDFYATHTGLETLIIHGVNDRQVSCSQSIRYASSWDNVSLQLIDCDHNLFAERHIVWAELIQFFELYGSWHPLEKVEILTFDLGKPEEVTAFAPYQPRFFEVLEDAYGDRCFSREMHLHRICSERHVVFLAVALTSEQAQVVGTAYIRPDGKRSATAVLREYQCRGIGRYLVRASLGLFPNQFTEVNVSTKGIRELLLTCGFTPVSSATRIMEYLGQDASLVHAVCNEREKTVYRRHSANHVGLDHEFMMLERRELRFG